MKRLSVRRKLKHRFVKLQGSGNLVCQDCELIKQPPPPIGYARKWHYWYLDGKGNGQMIDKTYCYKRNEEANI